MNNPDKSYNIWKAMVIGNSTWSAMVLRNKFERWDDNFVDIKDMEPKELFEYYSSTKEMIENYKPKKNMKIEVSTAEIDPHTEVFALDVDDVSLQRLQYGEVGSPYPYVKVADVAKALEQKAPRSASLRQRERLRRTSTDALPYMLLLVSNLQELQKDLKL